MTGAERAVEQATAFEERRLPSGLTVLAPGCVLEDEKQVRPGIMLNKNGEEVSR